MESGHVGVRNLAERSGLFSQQMTSLGLTLPTHSANGLLLRINGVTGLTMHGVHKNTYYTFEKNQLMEIGKITHALDSIAYRFLVL